MEPNDPKEPKDPKDPKKDPPSDPPKDPVKKGLDDLPEDVQAYIKELREENKSHRLENKKLSEDFNSFREKLTGALGNKEEEKPEETIQALMQRNKELEMQQEALREQQALQSFAAEHGIPADKFKYFNYLLNEASSHIGEEEELPEEKIEEIINEVKKVSGSKKAKTTPGEGTTSHGGDATGGFDDLTYEKFVEMDINDKVKVYRQQPELYNQYMVKARKEGKVR